MQKGKKTKHVEMTERETEQEATGKTLPETTETIHPEEELKRSIGS